MNILGGQLDDEHFFPVLRSTKSSIPEGLLLPFNAVEVLLPQFILAFPNIPFFVDDLLHGKFESITFGLMFSFF